MSQGRDGQVVTFYSYKGGTGRTMALANVAWVLAANGKRVLVVDWDLESPGLHRFFAPFMEPHALKVHGGIIDLIRAYEQATADGGYRDDNWHEAFARVHRHSFSLDWSGFPGDGALDFLSAGRHHPEYATLLAGMNWDRFYERQGGELFFRALRADMKRLYDYALIDSRTGLSDVADICTIEMPDTLVDCFTLSEQGIDGAATVAETIRRKYASRNIRILPVPMRVDPAEQDRAEEGRLVAKQRFAGLPADLDEVERDQYWKSILVPYRAFYAYEETLATFGDQPGRRDSLLEAYVALTAEISRGEVTGMPAMDEDTRLAVMGRFRRRPRVSESEVVLRYGPRAQVWAEWIQHILVSAGVRVFDPVLTGPSTAVPPSATDLLILGGGDDAWPEDLLPPGRKNPLVIYLADARPWAGVQAPRSASLAGLSEKDAVDRVVRLIDGANATLNGTAGPRYPGAEPVVFNAPQRNPRFTGREDDLRALRAQLRGGGATVVISGTQPVALYGMGGIGKTQLATEYVYRYRSAYDVVWWITAEQTSFIDANLGDLGARLGIQPQPTSRENALAVVHALNIGEPYGRWLIVFDNVEELRGIETFLPRGRGHVLITSRNALWGDTVKQVKVDVFEREESLAYLRVRVPNISDEEANRIASALGDLPIALATAGAWIAETGTPVAAYAAELERQGPAALALDAVWKLSLEELRRRSPGAHRLLQLCSLLNPEIALDVVYSDAMAVVLAATEPSVSDRIMRGALIRQVNRLGLLRIDHRQEVGEGVDASVGGQIFVHRLLQHVIRDRMTPAQRDELRHQAHLLLAALRPDGEVDDPKIWPRLRMLWPHVEVTDAVRCRDEAVRSLIIDRVRYLWLRGDLLRGLDRMEAADAAWTSAAEETTSPAEQKVLRRQLLHLRFHRANIVRDLGRFTQAHECDTVVLTEQIELLGEHHPHTLMTAGGLAADLRGLGRYPEALARDLITSAAWLELFGEDHPRSLTSRSNLAVSYRLNGDYQRAMEIDSYVYAKRRVVLGEQHPYSLYSGAALGRDLREAGEYSRSVALLREVYEATVRALGTGARAALDAKANLAVSLRVAGRAEEAADLLDEAFDRLLATFGLDSPHTLTCLLSRAVNMLAINHSDAENELDRAYRIYHQNLGARHPHTLVCVNNLALAARARQDRARARSQARGAADGLRVVLGERHPYTLAAQTNVAICTAEAGDVRDGLEMMIPLTRHAQEALGPEHPDTLRSLANEALMRRELGQTDVEPVLGRLRGTLSARLSSNHPAVEAVNQGRLLHRVIDPHPF